MFLIKAKCIGGDRFILKEKDGYYLAYTYHSHRENPLKLSTYKEAHEEIKKIKKFWRGNYPKLIISRDFEIVEI